MADQLEEALSEFKGNSPWLGGYATRLRDIEKQKQPIQRGKAMEPTEPAVKPGYLTTEFWLMLVAQLAPLAVLFKIIPQDQIKTVQDVLAAAIQNVAALVGSALMIWKYIQSRGVVKAATQTAKAAESNLLAANVNMRAADSNMRMESARASRAMALVLIGLFAFAGAASAGEIKLPPGSKWTGQVTGTVKVSIVVDPSGSVTAIVDPSTPLTITGLDGPAPVPTPTPTPIPIGELSAIVKTATAAIPAYTNKVTHQRSLAFSFSFLKQGTATAPVNVSRASIRQYCDNVTGTDKDKWIAWWAAVDAKLDSMSLTPATYTAALGEIATAMTADLPPAAGVPDKFGNHDTFGLTIQDIIELLKWLLPLLVELLKK